MKTGDEKPIKEKSHDISNAALATKILQKFINNVEDHPQEVKLALFSYITLKKIWENISKMKE